MIGPLPESNGFNAIEVFCDKFTKQIHVRPTKTSLDAEGFVNMLWDDVIWLHAVPRTMIADRGPQTVAKYMGTICKQLGITRHLSMAYHPETDGQTERMNQEIEAYLRIYVTYYQNDWSDWTLIMEFNNNKVHSATKYSPFYLDHGYHPFTGNEILRQSELPAADKWVETLQQNRENAEAALKLANEAMKP